MTYQRDAPHTVGFTWEGLRVPGNQSIIPKALPHTDDMVQFIA